ncbi:hypothetical protein PENTCL1PPCAC_6978 [Pristionchus entomophagus]|uniref:Spermatogenesis-associated protein 20-like TRX domain-containing protein n=1 Tax=Pristionchus entomophagus TaxID=358040 RepID=A0AAV5SRQ9_9BILA|nr:hypothetical protein PENTCL1PPCAC_6978 [Pristionchus entomophagus]
MFCRSNIARFLFSSRVVSNSSRFASMDRLANTKSPYILQHKNNPVEWYPWGAEAFERAKSLNRPIFLSVGYSTCHWCHVMERESFENQEVADILNDHFVSIKVDREERPDVDKLYMSFIQALNGGGGGWPMSVFLTPNLAPITGGTYFPPEDRWNQMGFKSILRFISEKWKEDPDHINSSAGQVLKAISSKSSDVKPGDPPTVEVCFMATFQKLKASFDEESGGFGDAPKFPKPVDLSFLLRFAQSQAKKRPEEAKEAIRMLTKTLHAIYHGGIHDHVGKGFHRYSVDGGWHVPHFEKMAYDQGQLLSIYSDVALLTGDEICKKAARDIVEYLEENLSQKDGGFWSAEDADSYPVKGAEHKKEGAFCVWKEDEVKEVLEGEMIDSTPLSDIVIAYYGIKKEGNAPAYTDPHDELKEQNVLIMHNTHEEMSEILGVESGKLREAIEKAKTFLIVNRNSRPKPHLDSKMVTAWQGLIISGLARASIALGDPMLARRAQVCVDFVKENLRSENGDLIRAVYTDEEGRVEKGEPIAAFSDDYSFLIQGLMDLYETTVDEKLIEWAEELQKKMDEKFWEGDRGYFVSESDVVADGGVRMIEDQDGAEPCASSVGMNNVVRLAELVETDEMVDQAEMIVAHAAPRLAKFPFILPKLLEGYERMDHGGIKVVIVAEEARDSMPFLALIRQYLIPNLALIRLKPSAPSWLSQRMELLEAIRSTEKPSVFICEDRACGLPITNVEDLKNRLEELSRRSILMK